MKRGLGDKVPDPQADPLDAIIPAPEIIPATSTRLDEPPPPAAKPGKRRPPGRRPPGFLQPFADDKAADPVKLSIRLSAESHATLRRLAAFTPDTITAIVQAAVDRELRRRLKAYEREFGRPLPDLP